jgi:hypothetical protein
LLQIQVIFALWTEVHGLLSLPGDLDSNLGC